MGELNSKPFTEVSDLMGCAKIMCEKHGDDSCKLLLLWVKFEFSENGSFSINRIQTLQNKLGKYDKGKTKINQIAFMMCESKKKRKKKHKSSEQGRQKEGMGN